MKMFLKKYYKWFIVAILLFIFAFITKELLKDELKGFDTAIYSFIISIKSPVVTQIFKSITFFASPVFLIILSILLFFIFKNKKYGLLSAVNLIVITIINQILKFTFTRERPFEWMLIEESGYSFPSGHAMVSMAFYGMLIFLIWQTQISKTKKKLWTIVLTVLILLIGISRIYLGVHYASDIIGGFTLSLSYLIIATSIVMYYLKYKHSKK